MNLTEENLYSIVGGSAYNKIINSICKAINNLLKWGRAIGSSLRNAF